MAGCFVYVDKAVFSIGPLPLRGPLLNLLPQTSRCKGPQDRLLIAREGGKMPITPDSLTDNPRHLMIRSYNTVLLKAITGVLRTRGRCAPNGKGACVHLSEG